MGIRGGFVLVPWRPFFWIAAEVVDKSTRYASPDSKALAPGSYAIRRAYLKRRREARAPGSAANKPGFLAPAPNFFAARRHPQGQ